MKKRKSMFDEFFEHRSFLIEQYTNGKLTKKEFLERNLDYFTFKNSRAFIKIDSYEKGLFNYQYFNAKAKYYKILAKEVKNTKKHSRYYNYYLNLANKYYHEKDKTVVSILKLIKFKNVESYYIRCESKSLKNSLYEIVLKDKKEAIFHSKAIWLLNILKEEKIFDDIVHTSIIESYINET